MGIAFMTTQAAKLHQSFKDSIEAGHIKTWQCNVHGDFYHTDSQTQGQAWFRPVEEAGRLRFRILCAQGGVITWFVYAYFHGHLTESFITHFHDLFSSVSSTASPSHDDVVSDKTS